MTKRQQQKQHFDGHRAVQLCGVGIGISPGCRDQAQDQTRQDKPSEGSLVKIKFQQTDRGSGDSEG